MLKLSKLSCLAMVIALGGCAHSDEAMFPSLFGTNTRESVVDKKAAAEAGIVLGATDFKPINVSSVSNTGTFVGQKVMTFRRELSQLQKSIKGNNDQLQKLRKSIVSNALQYHKTLGVMEAKLQVGTTPGNPRMFDLLNSAQRNIQTMSADLSSLNKLSASISADTANTDYLSEAIRSAYSISGAVDEDHAHLRILENEASQTAVLMHSLQTEIDGDIIRQQQYIDAANSNLVSLNDAIRVGSFGVSNPLISTGGYNTGIKSAPLTSSVVSTTSETRPLFSVDFANRNVDYKDSLKQAVGSAVAKKKNAVFDVVAVSSPRGQSAQNYASDVFQEIVAMGISADRVNISSKTDATVSSPLVKVFVR